MTVSTLVATMFANGSFEPSASGETLPVVDPATGSTTGAISAAARRTSIARCAARGGVRGCVGPLARPNADGCCALGERSASTRSGSRRSSPGHRQADLASARRPGRDRALLRVLRRRRRQAARRHVPYLPGYAVQVLRVPVGVTGHIIPWNYPTQMFARSLAPSLAVGNATVIKPSEDASQSIVELAKLAAEAASRPARSTS